MYDTPIAKPELARLSEALSTTMLPEPGSSSKLRPMLLIQVPTAAKFSALLFTARDAPSLTTTSTSLYPRKL